MAPTQITQTQMLEAIARALPEGYLDPMRAIGPGYELLQGFSKIGTRCSLAVGRFEQDGYILSSGHGVRATIAATFYRPTFAAGAGCVNIGTLIRTSVGGRVFRVIENAVFGATDLEITVDAMAIGYGYEWNIKGPFVDPNGATWPGELDTIDLPLMSPPYWDPTIQVRNDADADGLGRPATLDALGGERGLRRQTNEGDANYQTRIRQLPDTVSPSAIIRQLTSFFRPYGVTWRAVETWQHEYQECYDAPEAAAGVEPYDQHLFVYDDPDPESPFRDRWLSETDYLGAFIVEIIAPEWLEDYGMAYDDPAETIAELASTRGDRAISVYDAPDLGPDILLPAYDGFDVGFNGLLNALLALLDDIKLGGVYVAIVVTPTPPPP